MNEGSGGQGAGRGKFTEPQGDQIHSALFAQMVIQQSNLALMLLGKSPHPETGQPVRDLDAAKLFIDQLEMLEVKTRGNLNPNEAALLKQSLMTLHLAFVEAANAPETPPAEAKPLAAPTKESTPGAENKTAPAETTGTVSEAESQKRFSKKYSA
jgi:hypothetical protein